MILLLAIVFTIGENFFNNHIQEVQSKKFDGSYIPTAIEAKGKIDRQISFQAVPDSEGVDVTLIALKDIEEIEEVAVQVRASVATQPKKQRVAMDTPTKNLSFDLPMTKAKMVYEIIVELETEKTHFIETRVAELYFSEADLAEWSKGTFETRADSIDYHFKKHGEEVNALHIPNYLQKAHTYKTEIENSTENIHITTSKGPSRAKKYKHQIDARYIILTEENPAQILSFGR